MAKEYGPEDVELQPDLWWAATDAAARELKAHPHFHTALTSALMTLLDSAASLWYARAPDAVLTSAEMRDRFRSNFSQMAGGVFDAVCERSGAPPDRRN